MAAWWWRHPTTGRLFSWWSTSKRGWTEKRYRQSKTRLRWGVTRQLVSPTGHSTFQRGSNERGPQWTRGLPCLSPTTSPMEPPNHLLRRSINSRSGRCELAQWCDGDAEGLDRQKPRSSHWISSSVKQRKAGACRRIYNQTRYTFWSDISRAGTRTSAGSTGNC